MKSKTIALCAISLSLTAMGVFCLQEPFAVNATEDTSIATSSNESSSIESSEVASSSDQEQSDTDYFKNLYESYIVPILGSVSLTSVLAAIVAIVTSLVKRKGDKNVIASLDAKTLIYEKILTQSIEAVNASKALMDSVKEKEKIDEQSISEVLAKCDTLLMSIANETEQVEKVQQVKEVISQLTVILGKMASNTKELVASGVAEDIEKLIAEAKELK